MSDKCSWPNCKADSDVSYSVEGNASLCNKHLEAFYNLQDEKGDVVARAKIGLPPRKKPPVPVQEKPANQSPPRDASPPVDEAPPVEVVEQTGETVEESLAPPVEAPRPKKQKRVRKTRMRRYI
jgi:hypothetical protein